VLDALDQLVFDHSAGKCKQAGLPDSKSTDFPGAQGKAGYSEHLRGLSLREAEPLPPSFQFRASHCFYS
jgi:hypothetical protein